jgi:hypothetical protein
MVHIASSRRLHQVEVEDRRVDATGCIGPDEDEYTGYHLAGTRKAQGGVHYEVIPEDQDMLPKA